jgi:DGQHR domain-containing protein
MREYLLANLTDEERSFAAGLREDPSRDLPSFITAVFTEFNDPLLSVDDVAELWGEGAEAEAIRKAMDALCSSGTLEWSDKTQRPFDPPETRLYRLSTSTSRKLRLIAIESQAPDGGSRYQFSIEGRLVRELARIDRLDALAGTGNQRNEIRAHVEKIRSGIAAGTHVPNPVLLVFIDATTQQIEYEEEVADEIPASFVVIRALEQFQDSYDTEASTAQRCRIVEIQIPWRRAAFDDEKSVLLVDGQQRTAALSLVPLDTIPFVDLGVSAVVAAEEEAKRVFQVANETVKISTDFSKALLASMEDAPGYLRDEQLTAEIVRRLALENRDSPFFGIVKYPGAKASGNIIVYNSLFGLVSAFRKGLPDDISDDVDMLTSVICNSFSCVRSVWPDAWGLKPSVSKLMHGAGLRAISQVVIDKLQNYLSDGNMVEDQIIWEKLEASLSRLAARIAWTDSEAAAGTQTQKRVWREQISGKQNTNQDITTLKDFLTRESVSLDMKAARTR